MNYIHSLQATVASQKAQIDSIHDGLTDLTKYLTSPKFQIDPTVQASDVLHRVAQILHAANGNKQDAFASIQDLQRQNAEIRDAEARDEDPYPESKE
jgi:hypothetical protein